MKVQPETLKCLTEVSIQGRKSVFMSLDPFLGLSSWHCLCIYPLIAVVFLIGFNAVINMEVWNLLVAISRSIKLMSW